MSLRPEPRGRMRCIELRPSGAEQFFAQRAGLISCLVTPAPGQFRHQHVGDVFEIAGGDRKRHVQPVDVGLIEPCLDGVAAFSGVPTTTGPMPPIPTCCATSRTVQTRSGSARVMLSERAAAGLVLDVAGRPGRGRRFEKSTPVQPDIERQRALR